MKPKNLKIDVVEKYFIPVTAGIEVNILNTYSVLAEKGFDVTVHTSKDTLTQKNVLPDSDEIKGIKVKRQPFNWWGFWPRIDWMKTDLVCLHNFNVSPHFFIMFYTLLLKVIGKKKFVLILTPHGGFNPEWSVFPAWIAAVKRLYHYTLGTVMINLVVDKVRAVSEWEREEMLKKGLSRDKVVTISNGIEDEAYKDIEKLASDEIKKKVEKYGRYIIQIGRVYPIKNYETTIRALAQTPKDLNYLIVGPIHEDEKNKSYKSELDDLIKELGLQQRVHFLGVIKGADKFYLIRKAQMMVHMAIWESFCNVVHEGLSQGLVCIVANAYALPYLVKDRVNGFCVETHDVTAVSEKINYVLEKKNTRIIKEMEERNRHYGLENSWRNVSQRMADLYVSEFEKL